MIPAVTYHEDADITDLEAFRVQINKENEKAGIKVTMLAFMHQGGGRGVAKVSRNSTPRSIVAITRSSRTTGTSASRPIRRMA